MKKAYLQLMEFGMMGIAFDERQWWKDFEDTEDNRNRARAQRDRKRKEVQLKKGMKEFIIDGKKVIALNEKNAIRKAKKINGWPQKTKMQKHTTIYRKFFNIGDQDRPLCEHCSSSLNDVHHIFGRGKGKDVIENLIGLCRRCHKAAHHELKDMELDKGDLIMIHRTFIARHRPDYKFNMEIINRYKS